MASPSKIKTIDYTIPTSHSESSITVRISEPNISSENLGLETWASSHILSSQLHHLQPTFPSPSPSVLPILELGAGTGLVGISAAALWSQPVILTDLGPIVPGLESNIALNTSHISAAKTFVKAGTLDWTHPRTFLIDGAQQPQTRAHVILAADTIYSSEHPELLANVMLKWLCRDKEARMLMAYPLRTCYLDEIRELWTRLEEGGLEARQEGRQQASEELFDDECLVEWSVWAWKGL